MQRLVPKLIASLDRAIRLCARTLDFGQAHEMPPRRKRFALAPLIAEIGDSLGLPRPELSIGPSTSRRNSRSTPTATSSIGC